MPSLSSRITATETGGIFGVTAGTGLSGGGTSGTVTVDVDFSDATLASNISGSFQGHLSSSLVRFGGDIRVAGDVVAERYIVSSSVTHLTQSFSSGSTIFGDGITDTHQFTGSILISGSLVDSNIISGSEQLPSGIISGSSQLPSGIISGSGQIPSVLPSGVISGSTQVFTAVTSSGDISGSGTGSFGVINVGGGIFTSSLGGGQVVVEVRIMMVIEEFYKQAFQHYFLSFNAEQ